MRSINCLQHVPDHKKFLKDVFLILTIFAMLVPLLQGKAFAQRKFYMERPKLGMELSFEYEKDIRTGPFIDTEKTTRTFMEKLEIETLGYVYHPALLIFKLAYLPEWEQTVQHEEGADPRTTKPFLSGYDTEFTFLKYKPYTLILSATRDSTTTRSNYAERSKAETDIYGARLLLKYPILPANLSYYHTEGEQTGFYEANKRKDQVIMNMRHDKYLGTTVFDTSYTDSTDSVPQSTIESNEFKVSLNNTYYFTEEKDIVLNSVYTYNDRDSTNSLSRRYTIIENLRWIHTYNLSTNYSLRYSKDNLFDKFNSLHLRSESKSVGFNLNHLLYENLRTTINMDAKENSTPAARDAVYGSRIDFNYTRKIPIGVLNLSSGFDYRIFDTRPRGNASLVLDEPLFLSDGLTTYLKNENVNTSTIVITDDIGFIYREGIDYTVVVIGTRTGIKPTPFSIILGKILTVNYEYRGPAFDYSTLGQSYGINLNLWKVWRVYYLLNLLKQKFISGNSPESLKDDSLHTAGTEFDWKWNRTIFEWEDEYTDTMPLKRWTLTDIITLKPNERSFFSLSAKYGETRFKDTQDFDKTFGIKSTLQLLVGERGYWDVQLFFDRMSGTTDRIITKGINSAFEWAYNIYTLKLTYEYSYEDDEIARQTFNNNYFLFNIKRTLF